MQKVEHPRTKQISVTMTETQYQKYMQKTKAEALEIRKKLHTMLLKELGE